MTKYELVGTNSIIYKLQRNKHTLVSVSVSPCRLGDVCWVTGTEVRRATTLSHVKLQCSSEPQTHENTMMSDTIDSYSAMELHGDETKTHIKGDSRLCSQLGTR